MKGKTEEGQMERVQKKPKEGKGEGKKLIRMEKEGCVCLSVNGGYCLMDGYRF